MYEYSYAENTIASICDSFNVPYRTFHSWITPEGAGFIEQISKLYKESKNKNLKCNPSKLSRIWKSKLSKGRYAKSALFVYNLKKNLIKQRGSLRCEICGWGKGLSYELLQAHHIIPISCGGKDIKNNVIILCPNHHRIIHHIWKIYKGQWNGPRSRRELIKQVGLNE